ncbi:hypothetical protein FA09DRAFT_32867 [Tilletiopsis washingtonensis]|uniref:Uncharacterized protein n=1 Tax=Tilletiopsis washingtonensis TaxID=58919 RepID=A0A316ZCB8_9BASI|nr:hypothetical protein FA09DRAFT_32867 [Tilletiopsis washingtonensis]PWN97925.1 hypothetical protein FA09DRAFT_32867 [Tilletiopsis washingtonensis]
MADSYMPGAKPGFLNARSAAAAPPPPQRNFLARFWAREIMAPEKQAGNLAVAWGVGIFVGGIALMRTVGESLLVPQF